MDAHKGFYKLSCAFFFYPLFLPPELLKRGLTRPGHFYEALEYERRSFKEYGQKIKYRLKAALFWAAPEPVLI